jgi:hypothetical protein
MTNFHEYIFSGHPLAFTGHLIIWSALTSYGKTVPLGHAQVQSVVSEGRVLSAKRAPYRMIELRYFLDRGKLAHNLPKSDELFRHAVLALPKTTEAMEADIYAATHSNLCH